MRFQTVSLPITPLKVGEEYRQPRAIHKPEIGTLSAFKPVAKRTASKAETHPIRMQSTDLSDSPSLNPPQHCESPTLFSPITLSSGFSQASTSIVLHSPCPQPFNLRAITKLIGKSEPEKPLLTPEECASFFSQHIEGPYLNAFSKKDHDHLLENLIQKFNFSEIQCDHIRDGLRLLTLNQQQDSRFQKANSVLFANKLALLNTLYTLQEEKGYSLLPHKEEIGLFPHLSERTRETVGVDGILKKKPVVHIGSKTIVFLNRLNESDRELGRGSYGRVRIGLEIENGKQKFLAIKKMRARTFHDFVSVCREYYFGRELSMHDVTLNPISILFYEDSNSHTSLKIPNTAVLFPLAETLQRGDFQEEGRGSSEKINSFGRKVLV